MMLKKTIKEIEESYYLIVDELEQKLGENNVKIPEFTFKDLEIVNQWSAGHFSSSVALAKMDLMDSHEEIAYNKVVKKMDRFYAHLPEDVGENVEELVRLTAVQLTKEVKPKYITYLGRLKAFFEKLVELDKTKIPVIYGFEQADQFMWVEMPLDQAIRYTRAQNLQNEMFFWNDFMVMAGPNPNIPSDKPRTWFLLPSSNHVNIFKRIFSINLYRYSQESKFKWYTDLETRMFKV